MRHVGIDLAWGTRNPTGVAALDDDGRLLAVTSVRTDADILAATAPYVADRCLVAIDAPLVVTNPTGSRPCEQALSRDFRAFEAGAHPANTGLPVFADGPRGARVADALGLAVDPTGQADRRAIEVYPHPATIALFRLGRTLKYKQKPGRDVDLLRAELLRLVGLLESLAQARVPLLLAHSAEWSTLVAAVRAATHKSQLRVVEDQVDAVVCAHVARFATHAPDLTTTYGDGPTGFVVTPSLPADLRPTPRSRPGTPRGAGPSGVR